MPSVNLPLPEIDAEPGSSEQVRPVASRRTIAGSRKYGLLSRLRSYFILDPLIWLYTVVFGIASIPVSFFGNRERILHGFAHRWSELIMKTIGAPVRIVGLEKIDTSKPYIYAVNHASALDIPLLYTYLPFQFRIAFKKELLSYPIVGWHLKRSGQICIDRENPGTAIGSVRAALRALSNGIPLVIFPEGGRSHDGVIKPFLAGAFFLALTAHVDVVPVALVGTFEMLPMDTYHIKSRPLEMRVGAPISTADLNRQDMEVLSSRVQKAMEDLYYATG